MSKIYYKGISGLPCECRLYSQGDSDFILEDTFSLTESISLPSVFYGFPANKNGKFLLAYYQNSNLEKIEWVLIEEGEKICLPELYGIILDLNPKIFNTENIVVTNGVLNGLHTDTHRENNIDLVVNNDSNGLDFYLEFNIGSEYIPNSVDLHLLHRSSSWVEAYSYDHIKENWVEISINERISSKVNHQNYDFALSSHMVDGETGSVKIRFTNDSTDSSHYLSISHAWLKASKSSISVHEIADAILRFDSGEMN